MALLPDTAIAFEVPSSLAAIVLPLAILVISVANVLFGMMRRR